ncbi:MAG: exodeoxyribonuclease VII small subunit [Cyclobacteriaceae bacterium]|nr:exodeoxyribonuclease VII small subunit [Cyclobacteriaceae bacterium]
MNEEITYESALQELQDILKKLESGEISLDEITENVKRATFLLGFCQKKLRALESDLDQLLETEE